VIGPRGSLDLSGAELRQRLGLRSTLVRFAFEQPAADLPADLPADSASGSITRATALAQLLPPPPLAFMGRPEAPILVASGRGFGHGVGMSQWGAYAMALRGSGYAEILRHYYRGAELSAWAQP
jgi:stage II sporulation protein D